jgi:hypothetical protein
MTRPDEVTYDLRDFGLGGGTADDAVDRMWAAIDRDDPAGTRPVRVVIPEDFHRIVTRPMVINRQGFVTIDGGEPPRRS